MRSEDKKYILIVLIFLFSAAVSWHLYFKEYLQKDTYDIAVFPTQITTWTSKELPISEADYEGLETRNAFVRKYSNPEGKDAYIFVVYSQNNRKVSHPPEICYTGSGVSVLNRSLDRIPIASQNILLEANRLVLAKGATKQIAYYWFKVGNSFTASYWKQQMLIALKTIFGKPASSALIRVSVTVINDEEEKAVEETRDFIRLSMPYIVQYLP